MQTSYLRDIVWAPWCFESPTNNSTVCSTECSGQNKEIPKLCMTCLLWGECNTDWWFPHKGTARRTGFPCNDVSAYGKHWMCLTWQSTIKKSETGDRWIPLTQSQWYELYCRYLLHTLQASPPMDSQVKYWCIAHVILWLVCGRNCLVDTGWKENMYLFQFA